MHTSICSIGISIPKDVGNWFEFAPAILKKVHRLLLRERKLQHPEVLVCMRVMNKVITFELAWESRGDYFGPFPYFSYSIKRTDKTVMIVSSYKPSKF